MLVVSGFQTDRFQICFQFWYLFQDRKRSLQSQKRECVDQCLFPVCNTCAQKIIQIWDVSFTLQNILLLSKKLFCPKKTGSTCRWVCRQVCIITPKYIVFAHVAGSSHKMSLQSLSKPRNLEDFATRAGLLVCSVRIIWANCTFSYHGGSGQMSCNKKTAPSIPNTKKKLWEYIGNDVLYLKTVKAEKLGEQSCNSYLTWNHCHLTGRLTWLPRQSWAVSCKLQRRRTGVMNFWTVILNRKGVQDGSRMLVVVSTSQFHIGFNFFA